MVWKRSLSMFSKGKCIFVLLKLHKTKILILLPVILKVWFHFASWRAHKKWWLEELLLSQFIRCDQCPYWFSLWFKIADDRKKCSILIENFMSTIGSHSIAMQLQTWSRCNVVQWEKQLFNMVKDHFSQWIQSAAFQDGLESERFNNSFTHWNDDHYCRSTIRII